MSLAFIKGLSPTGELVNLRLNSDGSLFTPSEAPLITETPLTAPGSTPARSMAGYGKLTYQFDVSGIGTNIVIRAEGNLIGANFINLDFYNKTWAQD